MKAILFDTSPERKNILFLNLIEQALPKITIEKFNTFNLFLSRLREPRGDLETAIIFCRYRPELDNILSVSDLLSGFRIILILPDHAVDTIALGHQLFPRYMSFIDSDYHDVIEVLTKMGKGGGEKSQVKRLKCAKALRRKPKKEAALQL